jgi:hypothetical protein
MGVDFLRSTRQRHTKAWNSQMLHSSGDMFAVGEHRISRVVRASVENGSCLAEGAEVLIRQQSHGPVVVSQDICLVGSIESPSRDLLGVLQSRGGLLAGRVYACYEELGFADVEVEA